MEDFKLLIEIFAALLSGYLAGKGYFKKDTNMILIGIFVLICTK